MPASCRSEKPSRLARHSSSRSSASITAAAATSARTSTMRATPSTNHGSLPEALDRKSTRLNSSHVRISYAVFCLKKKTSARGRLFCRSKCAATLNPGAGVLRRLFFFNDTAPTEFYTLSLHDALPICSPRRSAWRQRIAGRCCARAPPRPSCSTIRSEEHTSELQSRPHLVCRLLLEKKKNNKTNIPTLKKKKTNDR